MEQDLQPDQYCDVVMKGGITSGIVYPPLVAKLADHYHLKNIGGTSAGAIAAVASAAAEYFRRVRQSDAPFPAAFADLPKTLAETVDGKTKLFSLFQPTPGGCARLFRVLTAALNSRNSATRVFSILGGFLLAYWPATLFSILLALFALSRYGWQVALVVGLVLMVATIGLWVFRDITRDVVQNNYGLCTGLTAPGSPYEALTPWLHGLVQELAGKPLDAPLTFEDLWQAPGFPPPWLNPPPGAPIRSIDLRMFTTNVTAGRPFVLPLTHETCRIFFQLGDLKPYLPDEVLAWVDAHSVDYAPKDPLSDPPVEQMIRQGLKLRELPPGKWPVVMAARLSLSFPLLFAAVPLWAINYNAPLEKRSFKRCLFADGGLSSNFPIHLFDGLLPLWPTFGIQLEPKLPERENMVFLPQCYAEGYGERWYYFDENPAPAGRLGGLLAAIVGTMQNWGDNVTSRLPGVRDRVVRVRLNPDEGGMNLNMPPETIAKVAARGGEAADELLKRFLPPGCGWQDQRWIRFRVSLETLRARFLQITQVMDRVDPVTGSYDQLIDEAMLKRLDGEKGILAPQQGAALHNELSGMHALDNVFSAATPDHSVFPVKPATDIRVRSAL
jgi:predicted acylesterase/phospholipase RssA